MASTATTTDGDHDEAKRARVEGDHDPDHDHDDHDEASASAAAPAAATAPTTTNKGRADRKRRVAVLFGYDGSGYSGLQFQRNQAETKTVEGALHEALVAVGAVSASNAQDLTKISWSRASRTDRGVHAAAQVVSANLVLVDPSAATAPTATAPKDDDNDDDNDDDAADDVVKRTAELCAALTTRVNAVLPASIHVYAIQRVNKNFDAYHRATSRSYVYMFPLRFAKRRDDSDATTLARLQTGFAQFVGSRAYHNFSPELQGYNRKAIRHIDLCEPGTWTDPAATPGEKMVVVRIHGDSFLLNQIRRMVGFVVEACRRMPGSETETVASTVLAALNPDVVASQAPTAPSEGLYLDSIDFRESSGTRGNAPPPSSPWSKPVSFEESVAPAVFAAKCAFADKVIRPTIARTVAAAFESWVASRDSIEFPQFREMARNATRRYDEAVAEAETFLDGVRVRALQTLERPST